MKQGEEDPMTSEEDIKHMYEQHVMRTYAPQLTLVRGKGTRVWDTEGKVYLDFGAGIAVLNAGHSNDHVVQAITRQAAVLTHVSNLYFNEKQPKLAAKLNAIGLGGKCFFANSGAEANEGMIKLARLWGHEQGRYEIVTMQNSFHGRTLATAAATGQEKIKKGFAPMPEGFVHARFNDLASVKQLVNEKTVAVMLEAVQGEGGVVPADPDFMTGVRALCDEQKLLMLCDEVQCGMGRTGKWWGYEHYGVKPDAFSVAKALGSGYPIGAIVCNQKLEDVFAPGHHASTFGGSPLACAAALATIEAIESERLVERAADAGAAFAEGLSVLAERYAHVQSVRGKGLMQGLVLDEDAKPLCEMLMDMGLLVLPTAGNVVRFLPPLSVKDSEIEEALDMLDDCLAEWHGATAEAAPEPPPEDAAAPAAPAAGAQEETDDVAE